MNRVALVILTAAVTAVVTSLLWVAGGMIAYGYLIAAEGSGSVLLAMEVDAPKEVVLGEEFELVVHVSNPTDGDVEFGSIDIYDGLLDGFEVLGVTPMPTDIDPILDFNSYYYTQTLGPGETVEVTFEMKAAVEGFWGGDIDCCTVDEDFVTETTSIRVTAAQEPGPGSE